MSLLREIQAAAIESRSDLETLLRKCRVLATRLGHQDFKTWVQSELDGYSPSAEVPEYRRFHCHCYGHFSGPFHSSLKNAPIPESCIPKEFRENLTWIVMREGVGELKSLIDSGTEESLHYAWPADACAVFGREIYERMNLMQAWGALTKSALVGILSTVRNRILNFALEIEASNPDAGEALPNTNPVPPEKVSQIFNNYIYGNVGNVASGESINQTAIVNIQQGDLSSVLDYLKNHGVEADDIKELETALKSDPAPSSASKPSGKRVSAWFGKMIQKSAEGTWKVTTNVASSLLSAALKSYYGI